MKRYALLVLILTGCATGPGLLLRERTLADAQNAALLGQKAMAVGLLPADEPRVRCVVTLADQLAVLDQLTKQHPANGLLSADIHYNIRKGLLRRLKPECAEAVDAIQANVDAAVGRIAKALMRVGVGVVPGGGSIGGLADIFKELSGPARALFGR